MKSFDEWFEKQDIDNWTNKKFMLKAFEAGQQSKQAEVDKLKKDNDGYRKLVNYDTQEMEKLHNKIDELKKLINDIELHTKVMIECLLSCSSPSIHMGGQLEAFMSISKILKGGQS